MGLRKWISIKSDHKSQNGHNHRDTFNKGMKKRKVVMGKRQQQQQKQRWHTPIQFCLKVFQIHVVSFTFEGFTTGEYSIEVNQINNWGQLYFLIEREASLRAGGTEARQQGTGQSPKTWNSFAFTVFAI